MLTCRLGKTEDASMQGKCKRSKLQAAYLVSIHTVVLRRFDLQKRQQQGVIPEGPSVSHLKDKLWVLGSIASL